MNGVELIAAERQRQIEVEGWTPEHDDAHCSGELALAACCYAAPEPLNVWRYVGDLPIREQCLTDPWPWSAEWDKREKHDQIRRLQIAGALIAAEIDRLQRAQDKGGAAQ